MFDTYRLKYALSVCRRGPLFSLGATSTHENYYEDLSIDTKNWEPLKANLLSTLAFKWPLLYPRI